MRPATVLVAVLVAAAVAFAVLIYVKVSHVTGQVGDVTGLVTNQTARVDDLLGDQTARVNTLLAQTIVLERALVVQRQLVLGVGSATVRLDREVHRVLRRFGLLFGRLLRSLRGQLPAQTATLVAAIQRGLRELLKPKR